LKSSSAHQIEPILIVSEDPEMRELIRLMVNSEDHLSKEVNSNQEALDLLENETYSLMILDLITSRVNWKEVAARAKKLQPELPIIVIGHQTRDDRTAISLKTDDIFDFLIKPFNAVEFIDSMTRALKETLKRIN